MGNGLNGASSFTSNGSKVTPLLFKSNFPTTPFKILRASKFFFIVLMKQDSANTRIPVSHEYPMGIEPASLMPGS
jgi:hypothetical protein